MFICPSLQATSKRAGEVQAGRACMYTAANGRWTTIHLRDLPCMRAWCIDNKSDGTLDEESTHNGNSQKLLIARSQEDKWLHDSNNTTEKPDTVYAMIRLL